MATDDLLEDGTEVVEDAKSASTSVSATDISAAVKAGLADFGGDLKSLPNQVGAAVQQAISQAQAASVAGTATQSQSDLTQQILLDPEKAVGGIVQKILTEHLGPYLATQVQDNYEGLVDKQREKIDSEYGEGVFDELILGELETVIEATPNKASKASKQYIATVVRGIMGHEKIRPKLMEKHGAKVEATKKAEIEAPNGILDGGRRRGAKPTLSPEDIAFLAGYEETTSKKVDRKLMEDAIAVRNRDGSWTADNFPGLTK